MKQLKEDFRLVFRGIGVIHRLSPYNLLAKCVRSVCNAAIPFVNFYLDTVNYQKWNQFYLRYNLYLGEKAQALRYEKIEDYQTHLALKNIDDAMKIGNYGLIKLHSRIPLFVENLLKVCFSIGLTLSVIFQKRSGAPTALQRFANSYCADGILLLLVIGSALACILANKRIAQQTYDHLGRLSKSNRISDYYLTQYLDSHRAGKDIRLYRQDAVILDELDKVGQANTGIVNDMNRGIFRCQSLMAFSNFALLLYTYLYIGLKSIAGVFAVGSIVKYSSGVLQFATAFSDMTDAFSQLSNPAAQGRSPAIGSAPRLFPLSGCRGIRAKGCQLYYPARRKGGDRRLERQWKNHPDQVDLPLVRAYVRRHFLQWKGYSGLRSSFI